MAQSGPGPLGDDNEPPVETRRVRPAGRRPSRGFYLGMGAVALVAAFLSLVGFLASQSAQGEVPLQPAGTPIPVEITVVPPKVTPEPDFTRSRPLLPHEETDASATAQEPEPVASSWSMPPVPVEPLPAPAPTTDAERLAREAQERFGIEIVLEGQDWGPDAASQRANIGAVISAVERLPRRVVSEIAAHPHGPLTVLSNRQGRTLGGWHPYGDSPLAFYTNSDEGPQGMVPANQVVLTPGASGMSIAQELLHAYQFRHVGPGQYVLAALGEEMRSFAAATGWRQVASDEEVRAAASQPWEVFNSLFVYEGRPLVYTTAGGASGRLRPANPLEAFAATGSIFYTRPAWLPLPDWPEYWAWFREHLGEPPASGLPAGRQG